MSYATIIKNTIDTYGEPIEFTPKVSGSTFYIRASVQSQVEQPLVNDLDQSGYMVYVSCLDIPELPKKFDRVLVRGVVTALDEDAKVEALGGENVVYIMRVLG